MVLMKKEIEFWKKKLWREKLRFGHRTLSSAAEHEGFAEAPLAPEGGLASHI